MFSPKSLLALIAVSAAVHGAPLSKRIAQVIVDSTAKWEQACLAAGGALQCNPVSVTAFSTLLAAAGSCDQQNAADSMVDLAKQLNNDADMIRFAQLFAQQPRNSPTSLSVQYCQTAPRNAELDGLFQCQFAGTNPTVFVGNVQVGASGTIPFGLNAPVSPPGSCPAHTSGGIADGTQLTDITSDPGVGSGSSDSGSNNSVSSSAVPPPAATSAPPSETTAPPAETTAVTEAPAASESATPSPSPSLDSGSGSSFVLQNGLDAQALNAKFAALSPSSSCTAGDVACVGGAFAQCVGSGFVLTDCNTAAGLTCAALPLVNSRGTSVTCTTLADAAARIANTGATGGVTGAN